MHKGGRRLNWDTLFSKQKDLDEYITNQHDLQGQALLEERVLALLVELGELANETRCFKFWSTKERSAQAVILEEYVDNIHFLLSIGLAKGYEFTKITVEPKKAEETIQFNQVFQKCIQFYETQSKENYVALFKEYLQLGHMLGFSETDVLSAYEQKNEVNYERQDQGY